MMLNFLDLSTASEDERRLIREILSDTSDDVNTSQPINFSNSKSNNGHATTTTNSNNIGPNNPSSQTTPAAAATSPPQPPPTTTTTTTTTTSSTIAPVATTTTSTKPTTAASTTTTTTATTNTTISTSSSNQYTTSNLNHGPNNLPQQNHRSGNQFNNSQQRKNIHSGNSISTMSNNNRNRINNHNSNNNNSRNTNLVANAVNNVQQPQQQQYYNDPQHYTPTLPSNISSSNTTTPASSTTSHYHNIINSVSSSSVSNNIANNVSSINNHSANALNSQRAVNNNEHGIERLRSNMNNHSLQNNDNNIVVTSTSSNHLVHTTQSPSMDQHLAQTHHHQPQQQQQQQHPHHHHHQHANNAMPLNVYNHHTTHMHHHQVPPPTPIIPVTQTSSGAASSSAKLDPKINSNNSLKNQVYHSPQDTSSTNMQINNTNNSSTGAQSVPPSAQMPQPMPGDMNSVIGMDMTSTQPPGYAMPPHVTAFGPPPHHVYGGPPIFQPYHYLIPHPYNMPPSYMPYVIAPNSVVPPRQQVPPQSSQPPSTSTSTSSYSRSHSRPHTSHHHHHHHQQQQQQQQHQQQQQQQQQQHQQQQQQQHQQQQQQHQQQQHQQQQHQQQQQHHHHHNHHQQQQQQQHHNHQQQQQSQPQQHQPNHDYNYVNAPSQSQSGGYGDIDGQAPTNQGPALKKSSSEKESTEIQKTVPGVKAAGANIQNDNRSSSQRVEKVKKNNVEDETSLETESPKENKSISQEQCAVTCEKSTKIIVSNNNNNNINNNLKTNNNISNVKANNVIKSGVSVATRNKNVVPNARTEKNENQVHKVVSDLSPAASQLAVNRNVQPDAVATATASVTAHDDDDIKHQEVKVPLVSSTTGNNEMVKISSDEGIDTQSSLDVSKQSQESSTPNSIEQSKSSPENCNSSLPEKRETTVADSNDINKSGDTNQRSTGGGAWGSASSKSWADLFKSGSGLLHHGSSINGETEHNNLYDSDNSEGENKTTRSLSNKLTEQASVKVNNLASSPKEQRSQEAAKRALDKMAPRLAQKINSINLKHSLPFLKPRGFINRGNGCYINATLQALIACPPFYNLMKEIGAIRRENSCTPILDSFAELFLNFPPLEASKKNKQTSSMQDQKLNINYLQAEAIEPKCIYNVLGQIKSECLKGAQEDAEEFLSSVLNCLHDEMISLSEILQDSSTPNGAQSDVEDSNDDIANDDNLWREVGPKNRSLPIRTAKVIKTPIQEIFGGSLFSIRTAGKDRCGHRSPFFDLQLDISSDNVRSVQDAIKSFTATEVIHDFYCSKTKQKLDAQRRTSLDQLPPILILHLKQFVYTQDHGLKKLIKKIEYPIDLELPENCLHEKNSADRNLRTSRSYKLLAVVYHDGKETIKGHYLTDVYHIGSSQWIRCDDSNLRVIPIPRIENPDSSRTPYLLFYRRLNTLRAQIGNHDNKKKS